MAVTPPPEITPAPTPAPQRGDRTTFRDRVDDFITWLTAAVAMFNAVVTNVYQNALSAFESAGEAAGSVSAAAQKAIDAAGSAGAAAGSAGQAAASAGQAAGSAEQAAGSVVAAAALINALTASSTTSLTISLGTKTLTTQVNKQFAPGADVKVVDANNAANAMYGTVDSYVGTTLQVNVTSVTGAGTIAAWNINVVGQRGPTGATGGVTGGTLQGALWTKKGADVSSATAPGAVEVWTSGGNYFTLTDSATITGLAAAPQAGAQFQALVSGSPSITASANLVVPGVPAGATYTLSPGDTLFGLAETTTSFRVIVVRADGAALSAPLPFTCSEQINATGPYVARVTGWHFVTLIGAGGRGFGGVSDSLEFFFHGVGGGAGAVCRGWRYLIAGQTYMVTLGARAAALTGVAVGTSVAGANGGDTSFSGTGIVTMTAGGGKGGTGVSRQSGAAAFVPGAAGGIASGGDENINGAASGAVAVEAGVQSNTVAVTGGAAPGIRGVSYSSGSVALSGTAGAGAAGATGGASIGGGSASVTVSGASANPTKGAGAFGPGTVGVSGVNFAGVAGGPAATFYQTAAPTLLNATAGGDASNDPDGNRPGGSASQGACGAGSPTTFAGGAFAASGGAGTTGSNSAATSGDAGIGAGSGAAVAFKAIVTVGAGGKAFAMIQR